MFTPMKTTPVAVVTSDAQTEWGSDFSTPIHTQEILQFVERLEQLNGRLRGGESSLLALSDIAATLDQLALEARLYGHEELSNFCRIGRDGFYAAAQRVGRLGASVRGVLIQHLGMIRALIDSDADQGREDRARIVKALAGI
ncbi:hypothetical protein [Magnetofaba australis]|uniref:Uncharacterized protein n=1 Tax=Magnetofaba australis IT-1 TaxID=1434232 RepID=A0A1Y2K690_9PROT|nr:hypothetical protein [Magnetofaba australis]OSM05181.1 hypothetical protein MAIT1_03340 [Magnetofaba australis IT-1]